MKLPPVVSVATFENDISPGASAQSSTWSTPEPASVALYETPIVLDVLKAGELAVELARCVSTSVVASAAAGASSRLPALSTATV